ncbi:MAG: hypothetical protein ACRDT4_17560 [Micromonosporaceae bacterium]
MAAWLLATIGAVGVAWVGVHPVADLGLAERPRVPQPQVPASPTYGGGNGLSDPSAPGSGSDSPSANPTSPRPGMTRSKLPTRSPTGKPSSPKPSVTPSTGPSSPPPTSGDPFYRDASTEGGTATFEYTESSSGTEVYVVDAAAYPGWEISAYRYTQDWVAVEFTSYDHVSTVHAYFDEKGYSYLEVYEEDTR